MTILSIDTSSLCCSLSLLDQNGACLKEISYETTLTHSIAAVLIPEIQQLLKATNTPISTLTHIAVNRGPGSFTGIRIGLATSAALAFANKIPLLGVSAMDALQYQNRGNVAYPLLILRDTKCGSYYSAQYENQDQAPTLDVIMAADLASAYSQVRTLITEPHFTADIPASIQHITAALKAQDIGLYALANMQHSEKFAVTPLYIKSPNITHQSSMR